MRKQLKRIRSEWFSCTKCALHENRNKTVSHRYVGRPEPNGMLLVGEAPGAEENAQGKPFVGRSGELLDQLLQEAGVENATIVNMVACKPPMNRDPKRKEIHACAPRLKAILHAAKPWVVVTLGRVATHALLNVARPMNGVVYSTEVHGCRADIVPVFHPAYLLRKPGNRTLHNDMVGWLRKAHEMSLDSIPF